MLTRGVVASLSFMIAWNLLRFSLGLLLLIYFFIYSALIYVILKCNELWLFYDSMEFVKNFLQDYYCWHSSYDIVFWSIKSWIIVNCYYFMRAENLLLLLLGIIFVCIYQKILCIGPCYHEVTGSLALWVECSPMVNPRSCHTKDFKNGTWYILA